MNWPNRSAASHLGQLNPPFGPTQTGRQGSHGTSTAIMGGVLDEVFAWRGREVWWQRLGAGPVVVFCHGTPWSSQLWRPFAEALAGSHTVYLWDMPGYGQSSKHPDHAVSLDVQGELFAALLAQWGLSSPHVIAHDYGGAVSLRAHLLHGASYASLALVDVVALAPWGSGLLPAGRQARGRLHRPASCSSSGRTACLRLGRQPRRTHARGSRRAGRSMAGHGRSGSVLPADRAGRRAIHRRLRGAARHDRPSGTGRLGPGGHLDPGRQGGPLAGMVPGSRLRVIDGAGHLVQLDQPTALAVTLTEWLASGQGTST